MGAMSLWLMSAVATALAGGGGGVSGTVGLAPRLLLRDEPGYSAQAQGGVALAGAAFDLQRSGARSVDRLEAMFAHGGIGAAPYAYEDRQGASAMTLRSRYTQLRLSAGHLGRLGASLRLGGGLALDVQATDWSFGVGTLFTYTAGVAAEVRAEVDVPLGAAHRVTIGLSAPLVGHWSRSPYAFHDGPYMEVIASHSVARTFGGLMGLGELASWGTVQAGTLSARWQPAPHGDRRIAPSVAVVASALRHTDPLPAHTLSAGLEVGARLGCSSSDSIDRGEAP